MSWWIWSTLISCVVFQKLDGSDLEGLVLDVDLVRCKRNSSINLVNLVSDIVLVRCKRNSSINLVIFLRQASGFSGEEMLEGSSGTEIL